jgi:FdhD protein
MCTPMDLEALAVGFLYNESLIQSKDEIASVRVCPTLDNIDIWLHHGVDQPRIWRRTSGCAAGATGADMDLIKTSIKKEIYLSPEAIQDLIQKLFESQELYREVGGVHTSALSNGRDILVKAEDIGRHNTIDKIAGRCLLAGIDPSGGLLLSTGRISSEMLQKAARMGIAIVISRTSPTSLSMQLAERLGITLIGYARRVSFNVYTHPERVLPIPQPELVMKKYTAQPSDI